MKERFRKVKVGPGTEPDNEMGPLITREHRDKVASYLDSGAEQGAEVVADGRETAPDGDGFFLGVSLLDKVTPEMDAYKDEIFAGALGRPAGTYDEAIKLVNENAYGNGVAIFTRDGGAARQFQHEVEVGMVGVNVPIPVPVAYYSFGGWKGSLFGDSHIYGPEDQLLHTGSNVTSRWPDPATSKVDLGFRKRGDEDGDEHGRGRGKSERSAWSRRSRLPPLERFGLRRKSKAERDGEGAEAAAGWTNRVDRCGDRPPGRSRLPGGKRLFVAAAVGRDVVEEASDTVEDAAEDVAEAARDRAGSTSD